MTPYSKMPKVEYNLSQKCRKLIFYSLLLIFYKIFMSNYKQPLAGYLALINLKLFKIQKVIFVFTKKSTSDAQVQTLSTRKIVS